MTKYSISMLCRACLVLILAKIDHLEKKKFGPHWAHIGPIQGVSIPVLDQPLRNYQFNNIYFMVPLISQKICFFIFWWQNIQFPCSAGLAWYKFWLKLIIWRKKNFGPHWAHIGPIQGVIIHVLDQPLRNCQFNNINLIIPLISPKNRCFFNFWWQNIPFPCSAGLASY